MKNIVGIRDRPSANIEVSDVALEHAEPLPESRTDLGLDIGEIMLMAGREIIEADHDLAEIKKGLDQIGTDKARSAGHQPALRAVL
jgi:hypothetical protein